MSGDEGDNEAERGRIGRWRTTLMVVTALLGVGVLVGLILTLSAADHQRDRALQRQAHSYEVMIEASSLAGTMADAEASLGRYVISGDKQLGQMFSDQWLRAGVQLDQLDRDVAAGTAQQRRIDALRRAYDERGRELSMTALNTAYHQNDQALARFYKVRSSQSLKAINSLLTAVIASERALLVKRSNSVAASLAHSNLMVRVLVAVGALIVIGTMVLGWMAVKAMTERAAARTEADIERERAWDLQAAVDAATAELQAQEARLRQVEKMEAVGQLTGGIAHDFNNMLAVILGGLELARRHLFDSPDQSQRHIDNALEGANRAATLTRRLLAFSRAEPLLPETIEAATIIAGMAGLLDRTLGDTITVRSHDDGCGWSIWVDRHQLENALLNLAVNARDAMEGRGTLTITTGHAVLAPGQIGSSPGGDYVTIAIADTGCGMTPEVLERVFEPFFTTKPVGKGTGLGLSQLFAFVRQSEGEIAITSTPGEGTTVTLYLPRRLTEAAVIAPTSAAPEPRPPAPSGLNILVVEDDPRVLTGTMSALTELGHYPIACGDPLAAEGLLDAHAIDLVMSDVLMPGRTGPELIASLAPLHPHLAVLFVTGYVGEAASDALAGHIVLRKPFTIAALERAVGEALAVARPAAAGQIAAE